MSQQIKQNAQFTPEEIETGLNHIDSDIRIKFAQNLSFTPTQVQIKRGLMGEYELVKKTWTKRLDFTPTPVQVERGLMNEDEEIRAAWTKRLDFTPTPEQIERGLMDEYWGVIKSWLARNDYQLKDYLPMISEEHKLKFKAEIEARLGREQAEAIDASSISLL